jgi:hypothetical protein
MFPNSIREIERDASAACQHARIGGLGEGLPEQQGDRLPRSVHAPQDGCQVVRVSGGWGRQRGRGGQRRAFFGPATNLSEPAHRKRVVAGGHLNLNPDHASGRAVLPDAVEGIASVVR